VYYNLFGKVSQSNATKQIEGTPNCPMRLRSTQIYLFAFSPRTLKE